MSKKSIRNSAFYRVSCALLILGLAVGQGVAPRAQEQEERSVRGVGKIRASLADARNAFILRAPEDRVEAIAERRGLTIIRRLDEHRGLYLVSGPSAFGASTDRIPDEDRAALQRLLDDVQSDVDVLQFEGNSLVVTPEVAGGLTLGGSTVGILDALSDRSVVDLGGGPAWNRYVNQPAAIAIRLQAARAAGATGAGIVAIIDTGVDPHHPLLAGSLVQGYDFVRDTDSDGSEWTGLDGSLVSILDGSTVSILDSMSVVALSGSTVAILDQVASQSLDPAQLPPAFGHGTMVAGVVHLVAPRAKIMPLRAFTADGTANVSDIVRAIYYAVDHGARVINMSFSATAASPEIAHAISVATSQGVICVAAAGNAAEEALVYPAALRNVLGVGSTSSTNPPTRSGFSNYGDGLVSLGAPGEGVITTYPGGGYASAWGTSFSAPLISGAAALMLQADSSLTQARMDSLLGNADAMVTGMGKGRLNLDTAFRTLTRSAAPPAIVLTSPSGGVSGTVVVAASPSTNSTIAGVTFLLDGAPLAAEDTTAPYEFTWDTEKVTNGTHSLSAVLRDSAGHLTTSPPVNVTVKNDTTIGL